MIVRPEFAAESPKQSSPSPDVLSDVLRAVRMTGAVFFSVEAKAPWAFEGPPGMIIGPLIRPGVDIIQFHAVASGSCWAGLVDESPVQLHTGDVLVVTRGSRHVLASAPGIRADPVEIRVDPAARPPLPMPVRLGSENGARCELICGFLGCEARPFNPLVSALPRRMVVANAATKGAALARLIELAREELGRTGAGRETVLARLAELMFVEALRRHVDTSQEQTGWLAGVADALVGGSLSALHARPGAPWTLGRLAREVGTSRSVLAERFVALVGMPPMHYLARWRMQLASELLSGTQASLAEIAERLGYGSEAALSRAFKRIVGTPPAQWRRGTRTHGIPPRLAAVP